MLAWGGAVTFVTSTCLVFRWSILTERIIWNPNGLNTEHGPVRYSDDSGIQALGFWIPTVPESDNVSGFEEEVVVTHMISMAMSTNDKVNVILKINFK